MKSHITILSSRYYICNLSLKLQGVNLVLLCRSRKRSRTAGSKSPQRLEFFFFFAYLYICKRLKESFFFGEKNICICLMFFCVCSPNIWLILKVVDLINESPEGVRPSVLVSATAVGYYGMFLTQNFQLYVSFYLKTSMWNVLTPTIPSPLGMEPKKL